MLTTIGVLLLLFVAIGLLIAKMFSVKPSDDQVIGEGSSTVQNNLEKY